MNKSTTVALYLLVIINLTGLGWIITEIGKIWNPPDYSDKVTILDSHLSVFDGDTYMTLNLRNDAPVTIRNLMVGVSVFDTNNTHVCTLEDYFFSTLDPKEERYVSAKISYDVMNTNLYRFKPFIGGASSYYDN